MDNAPKKKILEAEILRGDIKKVLFYHNTTYWYFGDLLRHTSWIEVFKELNLKTDVCTLKPYLDVFKETKNITKLIPIDQFKNNSFRDYDLVIIPSSFPITNYDKNIKRGLYSSNSDLVYTRWGSIIYKIKKNKFNYFTLANHNRNQTYLPNGNNFKITISNKEIDDIKRELNKILRIDEKVIILNPTASNKNTRENNEHEKEVSNRLDSNHYVVLVDKLLINFPSYTILIGASFKKDDFENINLIKGIKEKFKKNPRVKSIINIEIQKQGLSIRKFITILNDPRIKFSFGNGTGTNTHLATMLKKPSFSIERGSDKIMIENWKTKNLFQMGSFRWRNPEKDVAISIIKDWKNISQIDLTKVITNFKYHTFVVQNKWECIFKDPLSSKNLSLQIIKEQDVKKRFILIKKLKEQFVTKSIIDFYYNFDDECKYILTIYPKFKNNLLEFLNKNILISKMSYSNLNLINNLFLDSNLYKLIYLLSGVKEKKYIQSKKELIFRKIRVGAILTKKELSYLGYKSNYDFHENLTSTVKPSIIKTIKSYNISKKNKIVGGWEFEIYKEKIKDYLYKLIYSNPKSVYLTSAWTREGVDIAYSNGGGIIPPQTPLIKIDNKLIVLAKEINPIIFEYKRVNKIISNKSIKETELSTGWIDEQIELHIKLLKQGIFNFDLRFENTGIDNQGVFQCLDIGSLKDFNNIKYQKIQKRTVCDIYHLSINQIMLFAKFLQEFKNGDDLVNYFIDKIKFFFNLDITNKDLSQSYKTWMWGDHDTEKIFKFANQLRKLSLNISKNNCPSPNYPLINKTIEKEVFDLIH